MTGYVLRTNIFFFILHGDDKPFHEELQSVSHWKMRRGIHLLISHCIVTAMVLSQRPYNKMPPNTRVQDGDSCRSNRRWPPWKARGWQPAFGLKGLVGHQRWCHYWWDSRPQRCHLRDCSLGQLAQGKAFSWNSVMRMASSGSKKHWWSITFYCEPGEGICVLHIPVHLEKRNNAEGCSPLASGDESGPLLSSPMK